MSIVINELQIGTEAEAVAAPPIGPVEKVVPQGHCEQRWSPSGGSSKRGNLQVGAAVLSEIATSPIKSGTRDDGGEGFATGPVAMATEADFGNFSRSSGVDLFDLADSDRYVYLNSETCPDCSAGMIRQGRCCACPSCGFESCVV